MSGTPQIISLNPKHLRQAPFPPPFSFSPTSLLSKISLTSLAFSPLLPLPEISARKRGHAKEIADSANTHNSGGDGGVQEHSRKDNLFLCYFHVLLLDPCHYLHSSPSLLIHVLEGHFKYNHYPLIFFPRRLLFPPISSAKCWLLALFVKQERALFSGLSLNLSFLSIPSMGQRGRFLPPLVVRIVTTLAGCELKRGLYWEETQMVWHFLCRTSNQPLPPPQEPVAQGSIFLGVSLSVMHRLLKVPEREPLT